MSTERWGDRVVSGDGGLLADEINDLEEATLKVAEELRQLNRLVAMGITLWARANGITALLAELMEEKER